MSDADIMAMAGISEAALNVAGNITASTFNYEHTKELAKYQNDMNIANWNMANEYNSPANQMKRFEAAGLNPNLMYGQGSPGNASSVPSPSLHNPGFKNPFEGVQLANYLAQVKSIGLDNEAKRIKNDEEKNRAYESELRSKALHLFYQDKSNRVDIGKSFLKYGPYGSPDWISYEELRNTSYYQQLEQLWQKGLLNAGNIGLINAKAGVLGFEEEKNQLLKGVLEGDFDMKKLFTLLLLDLLQSFSSPGVVGKLF